MTNPIYDYLLKYFENKIESTKYQIKKSNKFFSNIEDLKKQGIISEGQQDVIGSDIYNAMCYAIEIVSACPNLEICLTNKPKPQVINKIIVKEYKPNQEVSAIGFQYEPKVDLYDDEDY